MGLVREQKTHHYNHEPKTSIFNMCDLSDHVDIEK